MDEGDGQRKSSLRGGAYSGKCALREETFPIYLNFRLRINKAEMKK
jgi:hypothetical protein